MRRSAWARRVGAVVVFLLALTPLLDSDVVVYKAGLVLVTLVAVLGLHVLVNWTGELSLAQSGAVGLPAFAVLTVSDTWNVSPLYLLPFGLLVGAATGLLIGLPALRAGGLHVALVTLVAGFAIDRFFLKQLWLIGRVPRQVAKPELGPIDLTSRRDMYVVLVVLTALALATVARLYHSKIGRGWFWVRANQAGAAAFGVPVARYRMLAYVVAGAFAGLAGGMYAGWVRTFAGQAFPMEKSFAYLLLAVIAGPGVFWGVVAAVLLVQGGAVLAADVIGSGVGDTFDTVLAYGGPVAVLLVIVKFPDGLGGLGRALAERLRLSADRTTGVVPAAARGAVPAEGHAS